MKRLYLSLYLLISLSMIGVTWTLEHLWQAQFANQQSQHAPLQLLAESIKQSPIEQRASHVQHLSQQTQLPLELLPIHAVHFADTSALQAGEVLTTLTANEEELQFIFIEQQVLVLGPLPLTQVSGWQTIYTLGFFIWLALALLAWAWPLSKDLKKLAKTADQLSLGRWDSRVNLGKSSQLYPLAEIFNEMAQKISLLIENQRQLTNTVSHEIRTPLARMKFALALLPSYCQPNRTDLERESFLKELRDDVDEIDKLLAEMLTYASLESGNAEPQLEMCDLAAIIHKMAHRLQPLSQIEIVVEPILCQYKIIGEPLLIERALQNLITNAQRYANRQISLRLMQDEQHLSLVVRDDGDGIPPEEQEKIFVPYYRSQQPNKQQHSEQRVRQNRCQQNQVVNESEQSGYGLGLAIVSRIMMRADGQLKLYSVPGCTEFSLHWPLAAALKAIEQEKIQNKTAA